MDAAIPVCNLIKTSSEWAESGLTVLRGQIGIETDGEGNRLYILAGDGNPANVNPSGVTAAPPYTRLRVFSLIEKTLLTADSALDGKIGRETTDRAQADSALDGKIGREITDRAQADSALDGKIGREITDRAQADSALGGRIDQEIIDRTNEDSALDGKIGREITDRAQADSTLGGSIETLQDDLQNLTDTKADKHNPAFTGAIDASGAAFTGSVDMRGAAVRVGQPRETEPPYSDPDNPATVHDLLDLFKVTIDTAGEYLMETDREAGLFGIYTYSLKLDREDGRPDELLEVDRVELIPTDYATKAQWDSLYDFVMSMSGDKLMLLDGGTENGRKIEMKADAEPWVNELLLIDSIDDFGWWRDLYVRLTNIIEQFGWYNESEWVEP
jgi:hypothetical protein